MHRVHWQQKELPEESRDRSHCWHCDLLHHRWCSQLSTDLVYWRTGSTWLQVTSHGLLGHTDNFLCGQRAWLYDQSFHVVYVDLLCMPVLRRKTSNGTARQKLGLQLSTRLYLDNHNLCDYFALLELVAGDLHLWWHHQLVRVPAAIHLLVV